jgi:hypothetical protein
LTLFILGWSFAQPSMAQDCSFSSRDKKDKSIFYRSAAGAALFVAWQASEAGKGALIPDTPRWQDDPINGYDQLGESMRWSSNSLDENAARMSDISLAYTTLVPPALAFLGESKGLCLYEDLLIFEETVSAAIFLNQGIKFLARRERPFARDLSDEEREEVCLNARHCVDLNLSFYSGHATMTFTAAIAAGTIAKKRGYKSSPAAYAFGLVGAGLTSYLRVAAGKHYLSDVTLGALSGVAFGYVFPTYLQPPKQGKRLSAKLVPSLDADKPGVFYVGSW